MENTKYEMLNPKQNQMTKTQNAKQYDLEERTLQFAIRCRELVKRLTKTLSNIEYSKQLIKSSGSVGANYREANESLSKKDFLMRIKICRKESKESIYWLNLVEVGNAADEEEKRLLIGEGTELMKIFGSIIVKSERRK